MAGRKSLGSDVSNQSSGTTPIARLGASGTRDATTFLRGDNTWATPAGGGGAAAPVSLGAAIPQTALPTWRAAYANRRFARANIATIGDSVQEGLGATSMQNGYLQRLADRVGSTFPLVQHSFKSASKNSPTWTNEWTFSGTGTEQDNRWYGLGLKTIVLPANRVMTTTFYGTSCTLHFTADLFYGTPTITIDGTAYTGPNLNNGSFKDGIIWTSPALPRGLHTISITAANEIKVGGIKAFDGDENFGVHIYPGGRSGAISQDFALNQFGGAIDTVNGWPAAYGAVNPSLIIIALGHNDYYFQVTPSTFQSNLQLIVNHIKAAVVPNPSFLFEIYPKRADDPATITHTWDKYVDAIKAVAAANTNSATFDFRDFMGATVAGDTGGNYYDQVHPNNKGYQRMSDITVEALDFEHDKSTAERNANAELTLTNDYGNSTPSVPANGVKIFARHKARRLLAMMGPNGLDTPVQPGLFNNRIARIQAVNNVAAPSLEGIAMTTVGTAAAINNASSSFFNSMVRYRLPTATTAGSSVSTRSSTTQWFYSSTANMGGFFMVTRFGFGAIAANSRFFCGFSATNAAISLTAEPNTLLNMVGLGLAATGPNFQIVHNGASGTGTTIDLGSTFDPHTANLYFWEFRLFNAAGAGQATAWSLERLNDGQVIQGTIPASTKLPAINTVMAYHLTANNVSAAAMNVEIQSIYIENDN